jgi:hypothetical protein
MYVQTLLKRDTEAGMRMTMAWLPADPRVKAGTVVTLKDDAGTWRVVKQYTASQREFAAEQRWGLDLPKSQRTER